MFSLSVFSTIILIIFACAIILAFILALRAFLGKRSSSYANKDNPFVVTFHLGKQNEEESSGTASALKEIPGKIWKDIRRLFSRLFMPNKDFNGHDYDSRYDNEAEHKMLEEIRREESSDYYVMPNADSSFGKKSDIATEDDELPEDNLTDGESSESFVQNEEKNGAVKKNDIKEDDSEMTDGDALQGVESEPVLNKGIKDSLPEPENEAGKSDKNMPENDLTYLFSIPGVNEKAKENETVSCDKEKIEKKSVSVSVIEEKTENDRMSILRKKFLEKKTKTAKAVKTTQKKRKNTAGNVSMSEEERMLTISMLEDIVNDCDELDKGKIKGRLEFLKKTLHK